MPKIKMLQFNKKWILPCILLLLSLVIISCIVTKTQKDKLEKVIEGMSNPATISTKNISTEKVKLLIPSLKAYLLSKYPTRKSLTSENDGAISKTWQDISGNKNDFKWSDTPIINKGFDTKNLTLEGPKNSFLELHKSPQFTIVLRVLHTNKNEVEKENNKPSDIGEVIANANLSNEGKNNLMSINVTSNTKEHFNNLKKDLSSDNQNQDTLKNILINAGQIKNILDTQPNKGKKPIRQPVALALYGQNENSLEIRLPNGTGNLEVDINGVSTKNIQKSSSMDEAYYTIVYNTNDTQSHIRAYVNTTLVIDENVTTILLDTNKKVIINPSKNLNVELQEVAFLNRALDEKEIGYMTRSDIVLKTILDNTSEKYVNNTSVEIDVETCEEDCTSRCTTSKCVAECSTKYKNACPKVSKDSNGNYIVRGSSYGNNKRVAKEIYKINFPNCKNTPGILDETYNKEVVLEKACPFIVNSQFNPCKFYGCENVNWDASTPKKAGMNQKCRKRVDAYCEEHAYLDPFCYCWRSENYDLPQCVTFRSKFNNPRDRGCSAADFPIQENPDFDKYIKKDRIPCWGCDIE